ncbi:hypothetical protein A2U01_0115104, partial [Trifolium medium]|nr:hypothetical protein [Trifolium medium]
MSLALIWTVRSFQSGSLDQSNGLDDEGDVQLRA